jgi:DNA-binding NtrC family response regulator
VLTITVPPLRHRHRDVLLLSDFFLKKYISRFGIAEKCLSLPAQAKLLKYFWPGNIRQLENVLQKSLLLSKGSMILDTDLELPENPEMLAEVNSPFAYDSAVLTLKDARAAAERKCINEALLRAKGNVTIASKLLDTDRKWLTKLIKLHGIQLT